MFYDRLRIHGFSEFCSVIYTVFLKTMQYFQVKQTRVVIERSRGAKIAKIEADKKCQNSNLFKVYV